MTGRARWPLAMYESQARLKRLRDGKIVPARTRYSVGRNQVADFQEKWRPGIFDGIRYLIARKIPPEDWPTSLFWDWPMKIAETASGKKYVACCVIADGTTQGLATIRLGANSRLRPRSRLAYVEYLQAAPWNQEKLCEVPRYGGVGTALIVAAIRVSRRYGYEGRMGLHSVRESESFYEDACGMKRVTSGPKWENQAYFEYDEHRAEAFRSRRK